MKVRLKRLFLHVWFGYKWTATTNAFCLVPAKSNQYAIFLRHTGRQGELFPEDHVDGEDERSTAEETNVDTDSLFDFSRRDFLGLTAAGGAVGAFYSFGLLSPSPGDVEETMPPFSSFRRYKSIELSNGMEVLLVSDKAARQSSACLSIGGAGQFADSRDLNGMAHLMEHMTLSSSSSRRRFQEQQNFDDWLSVYDGFSNGFTAFEKVCFHFNCPSEVFQEALERFAALFMQETIVQVCSNEGTLKREIRRINSELDPSNDFTREMYLIKGLINSNHPYARMTAGNIQSLEAYPAEQGIDVGKRLVEFFKDHYLPRRAKLVVISPNDFASMETWVAPFSSTLSRMQAPEDERKRLFPNFFLRRSQITAVCLFRRSRAGARSSPGEDLETLSFHWALSLDYTGIELAEQNVVTAPQLGFVLSQILGGRRGPGSLYSLLQKRKWSPEGSKGLPRISFPVDVSGFQLMKLQISLTLEGFANRSSVIAAVYDAINSLRENPLSAVPFQVKRELIAEYMTIGELYGYVLAPRPPDAIELAFDAQLYGIAGSRGVGNPDWRRLPLPQDKVGVLSIQRCLRETLLLMSDPYNTIIIVTASPKAIITSRKNLFDSSLPFMSPASWDIDPTTGARYHFDDMFRLSGKVNEWLVARLMEDELQSPVLNPLIPPLLRPARTTEKKSGLPESNSILVLDQSLSKEGERLRLGASVATRATNYDPTKSAIVRDYWAVLKVVSNMDKKSFLPLPRAPPEPSCRCAFVLQLLSTRPARANVRSAVRAELWKTSLEVALFDLAELGAPAGLAYEISFNKYGMRISFLGLSQNIGSYARRICRRILEHQSKLLEGPERFPASIVEGAIRSANRATNSSPKRKIQTIGLLRDSSTTEAAVEAIAFFKSCRGGVCFSEGDLLPRECVSLLADLKGIFRKGMGLGIGIGVAVPDIEDIVYRPSWIPRSASSCSVSGSSLISDACGRIPR